MSDSTFDAALSAFEDAGVAPDTDQLDASGQPVPLPGTPNPPTEASAPAGQQESQPEASAPELPASKEVDLSGLPEEAQIFLRARQREMEADYTRKTQEAAQQRQEAEQYTQFVQALNSDPEFALAVHNRLQEQLTQAGLIQARQQAQQDEFYGSDDEFDDGLQPGPDPYERELAEMRAWRQNMEAQMAQAQLNATIDRSISEIRSAHPDYTDADVQDILDLGYATGGDLHKANDLFQAMNDRVLARYLQGKQGVNTPAPLSSGQGSPAPEDLSGADDLTLRAVAQERLLNALGQ